MVLLYSTRQKLIFTLGEPEAEKPGYHLRTKAVHSNQIHAICDYKRGWGIVKEVPEMLWIVKIKYQGLL